MGVDFNLNNFINTLMSRTWNKFGGVAVSAQADLLNVVQSQMVEAPSESGIVVSAYEDVTDKIMAAMDEITAGGKTTSQAVNKAFEPVETAVLEKYESIPGDTGAVRRAFTEECHELKKEIWDGTDADLSPREETFALRDKLIRRLGEGSARRGTAQLLQAHDIPAYDLGEIMCGEGKRIHEKTQSGIEERLSYVDPENRELIYIAGGDIGGLPGGIVSAVGRSYSDTTAVDFAVASRNLDEGSGNVVFWKPEPGMMTADPRLLIKGVHTPQLLSDISLYEALEVARAGSSLLHVQALDLAFREKINLRLKGVATPEEAGTSYGVSSTPTQMPFKTIASHPHDCLQLDISEVAGEPGVNEYLGRVFGEAGISVNDIMTEGNTIAFTIPLPKDEADKKVLRAKIRDIQGKFTSIKINGVRRDISSEWDQESMANVSVVGSELANQEGLLKGIATALSSAGINIDQVSQTKRQHRLSFYVPHEDRKRAVQQIHMAYFDKAEAYRELMLVQLEAARVLLEV